MKVARLSSDADTPDAINEVCFRALKRFPQARAVVHRYRILDFQRFTSETKRMQCLVEASDGDRFVCVTGIPAVTQAV